MKTENFELLAFLTLILTAILILSAIASNAFHEKRIADVIALGIPAIEASCALNTAELDSPACAIAALQKRDCAK